MTRTELLGKHFTCICGREHEVPTRAIVIAKDAIERVAEICQRYELTDSCNLIADEVTYEVCGRAVENHLRANGYRVHSVVLQLPVKADDATCAQLLSHANCNLNFWIAVGSGTINDLTKYASTQLTQRYVAVATAPSMNGYTSAIAALTVCGLKKTLPANPPIAVIADLNVLCNAPYELIAAGLGDVMSKPVSNADWQLAHIIRGEHLCTVSLKLLHELEPLYFNNATALAQRAPEAIANLMEALCYSGISMTIAGSSSPASGGEHLIGHTLDMRAPIVGRALNLHGAQVGVATIFCATLYERLLQLDVAQVDVERLVQRYVPLDEWMPKLRTFFGHTARVVFDELAVKYPKSPSEYRDELMRIVSKWDEIRHAIASVYRTPYEIREALKRACAPTTAAELGISNEEFRETVLYAHTMRRRYTVLDVAYELGILPDELDDLLMRSGVIV